MTLRLGPLRPATARQPATAWWSVRRPFTRCLFFARPRSQEPPADVTSSPDAAIAHRLLANEGLFALPYDPWRSSCHLGA
ncbi:uncharacterized protein TrAtP1_004663 [Trichoderma atroviride]|uniref:uncharacterized protein n=1 Tax=Hypocrea atroviridis TaxID=63577 RepID=UPI0033189C58|nr:hypothetical protein TrAtP1_004663 [Trichoderma atroviride]